MTTTTQTPVKATWPITKIQEQAAFMAAANISAAMQILSKHGEAAVQEFKAATRKHKVAHLKEAGVKTPLELANALAEIEANVFGSQIVISGDDKSATLTYQACAMWNAMQKLNNFTPAEQEKMGAGFQTCMQDLASEFGFNANVKMEGQTCNVTFNK